MDSYRKFIYHLCQLSIYMVVPIAQKLEIELPKYEEKRYTVESDMAFYKKLLDNVESCGKMGEFQSEIMSTKLPHER